jgi:hypothetical protein
VLLCIAKAVISKFSNFIAEKWMFKLRLTYLFLDLILKFESHMWLTNISWITASVSFTLFCNKRKNEKKYWQNYRFNLRVYYILYNTRENWKNMMKGRYLKGHKKNVLSEVTRWWWGSAGWWRTEYGIGTA